MTKECKHAKTDMTPCYIKDGESALTEDGMCVGCVKSKDELDQELHLEEKSQSSDLNTKTELNTQDSKPKTEAGIKKPSTGPTKLQAGTKTDLLMVMLASNPGLTDKLIEALDTERFFITVTFQKKYKPDDPHDLHHFEVHRIPPKDCILSLGCIAGNLKAQFMPNAEIEGDDWH